MTKEQEAKASILRLDGKTPKEAAKILGVPERDVESVYYKKRYKRSLVGFEATKYVGLDQWLRYHGLTRTQFADKCGIHPSTMTAIMLGSHDFSKSYIDKILKATGLTYEEAFMEVENIDE